MPSLQRKIAYKKAKDRIMRHVKTCGTCVSGPSGWKFCPRGKRLSELSTKAHRNLNEPTL